MFNKLFYVVFTGVLLAFQTSFSYNYYSGKYNQRPNSQVVVSPVNSDEQIIQALNGKRNVRYVQGGNLVVVDNTIPDDLNGLPHQKFVVRLSNGQKIQIHSNLDLCNRLPLQIGDTVSVGGEFIWTGHFGLVHWVHSDKEKIRKDGYIIYKGAMACR